MLTPTQEKIHQLAMQRFLREDFQKGSLRRIVAESGFTSGAFCGYCNKKGDLFSTLVKGTADGLIARISQSRNKLFRKSKGQEPEMQAAQETVEQKS